MFRRCGSWLPLVAVMVVSFVPVGDRVAAAPQTAPQAPPVFKAEADLVVLHVNVFDGKSDAVPHLPKEAFEVYENGQPQTITFFNDTDVPVAAGLVVDNSSSMIARRNMIVAGGAAFAETSHSEDELFTVIFNEHVRHGLPPQVPFTHPGSMLQAALNAYPAGGMTALYDAVIDGLDHLRMATLQKRVLIVLSDGEDNASTRSRADMLHRTMWSDALIYAIYTGDLTTNRGDKGVLRDLAERAGGVLYSPRTDQDVVRDFTEIAGNIRRGYSIGYVPRTPPRDGEYRQVKVLVRANGKHLTVRARDGYSNDGNAQ